MACLAVLGRHVSAAAESGAFYARDLAIGPTRALQRVALDISAGVFVPDAFRSGYFPNEMARPAEEASTVDLVKEEAPDGEQFEISDESEAVRNPVKAQVQKRSLMSQSPKQSEKHLGFRKIRSWQADNGASMENQKFYICMIVELPGWIT